MKQHFRIVLVSLFGFVGLAWSADHVGRPATAAKYVSEDYCVPSTASAEPPVIALQVLAPAKSPSPTGGTELNYRILVENRSRTAGHHVVIHEAVPANARFVQSNPRPSRPEGEIQWDLGTMEGGARREIQFTLAANGPGDVENCVRVTFEYGLCVTTRVCQAPPPPPPTPARKAAIRLAKRGPAEGRIGEPLKFQLTITNTGDAAANNVEIIDKLPDGLDHSSGRKELPFAVGTLAPGESRVAGYEAVARKTGRLCNKAAATAEGGLRDEVESCVNIGDARLNLTKTGPKQSIANAEVTYTLMVSNPGTTLLSNVTVNERLPERTQYIAASQGGVLNGTQIQWALGDLPSGQNRKLTVTVKPLSPGEIVNQAQAFAEGGLQASAEARTEVVGASGLHMTLAYVGPGPVAVGQRKKFNIIVKNQGMIPATNLVVTAIAPPEMSITLVEAPDRHKVNHRVEKVGDAVRKAIYDPIQTLQPGEEAIYSIEVIGLKSGDVRFTAKMAADQLPAGEVTRTESTNIFNPEP